LHGGPGLSEYLAGVAEELSSGYEVFRYQQRGLEPSTTSGPFSIEAHLADAIAVMDHIGPGRLTVVGHSWGGHCAMFLARQHSDRLAGAVIVDPLGAVGDGGEADLGAALAERLPPEDLVRIEELDARAMR
jgi:pimeloyl-ACP methyl ester carboxylesterase